MRIGQPSTLFPRSGMCVEHMGSSDRPFLARIYDDDDEVIAIITQEKGACIDPGHVDFFMGRNCFPAVFIQTLVEILPDGQKKILHWNPEHLAGNRDEWLEFLKKWLISHGRQV